MRRLAPAALAAALLPALLSDAQAQGPDRDDYNPFDWCVENDSARIAYPDPDTADDHRAWSVWKLCLDQVTYHSRWSEFTEEEIWDYMIATLAADWGKAASKECTGALEGWADWAARQTLGMLANALSTKGKKGLAREPTYLAWVPWGTTKWQEEVAGLTWEDPYQEYGEWESGENPHRYAVAISEHLQLNGKWQYLVHEAMHWGPAGLKKDQEALIEDVTEHCQKRNKRGERDLKRKDPFTPGWNPDTGEGNPPYSGGGCTIWITKDCSGGGDGEDGDCDDPPDWGEDGPPDGAVCTEDEIVVGGGCSYNIRMICQGGSSAMLLQDAGLRLADVLDVEGRACPAIPATGPPAPRERPAWIAAAVIARPDDRRWRPFSRRVIGRADSVRRL